MAKSDTRFLYTDDDGNLVIVVPADECPLTLDEIKAKDCPSDRTVYTVDKSAIPTDRSFRDAWTYSE
jgi:hypothetical protein|tara:strand:+ start:1128 stop:1328 length:201 start_codon:yes stop_codon:yes gene_type:complete